MIKCPTCGKELKDGAKFCSGCGNKIAESSAANSAAGGTVCPNCGKQLKPGAKFCGGCGSKLNSENAAQGQSEETTSAPASSNVKKDYSLIGGYIHWNVMPGQIAVKIDENDIAAYGKVKGVSVQDGVKALFFVQGKLLTELDAGNYDFKNFGVEEFKPAKVVQEAPKELPEEKAKKKKGFFANFIANLASHLPGKKRERAAAQGLTTRIPASIPPVTIVLIRSVEFPFIFDFKKIKTQSLTCDIGMQLLCKVSNINEFYANLLVDKKFVCFDSITKAVEPLIKNIVNIALANEDPNKLNANAALQESVLAKIQEAVAKVYSYIDVTKILTLSADNKELERIRSDREELYVSEMELEQLHARNNFLNRLKDENNAQALAEAKTQVEFEAAMEALDEQHEMNVEAREKFRMLLEAQKKLRIAKNDDEVEAAMLELKKNGLLRNQEIDNLEHLVKQNAALRDMNDAQVLSMAAIQNQHSVALENLKNSFALERETVIGETEIDKLKLQREIEVGNARIQNELDRQRMQDEYSDSRFDAGLDREAKERRLQNQLDDEEMASQMRRLREAQALHQESESFKQNLAETALDNAHRREQESLASEREHEVTMAQMENAHEENMFANRSMEEIMALKGNIDSDTMKAKYAAEAEVARAQAEANAAMAQNGKIEELYKMMMSKSDADSAKNQELLMNMMNMMNQNNQQNTASSNANTQAMMQMFAQMAQTGMMSAAGAVNAANEAKLQGHQDMANAFKQMAEQNRADSNQDKDRFLAGMQTTIQAVGGAMSTPAQTFQASSMNVGTTVPPVQKTMPEVPAAEKKCPKCGAPVDPDSAFCDECGASL